MDKLPTPPAEKELDFILDIYRHNFLNYEINHFPSPWFSIFSFFLHC
jgi:hypothetical protein